MNIKNTLTSEDINKWAHDTLIYCLLPTLLVFLTTLQTQDFHTALGASYVALLAAAINLIGKYKEGVDLKDFPTGTQTIIESTPTDLIKTTKLAEDVVTTGIVDPKLEVEIVPKKEPLNP